MEKYRGSIRFFEKELNRVFKPDDFVFLEDMGDAYASTVPDWMIERILQFIDHNPQVQFLSLTKNPTRYVEIRHSIREFPENMVLGATIESNENYPALSKAPPQSSRIKDMVEVKEFCENRRFLAIEPILYFTNLQSFVNDIREIAPWAVAVGYDNYNNRLPEPILEATLLLIGELEKFTTVHRKSLRKAWDEK
jgi:protein gp37